MPRTTTDSSSTPRIIFIEGNIASGKSTLVRLLGDAVPNSQVLLEPVDQWQALQDAEGQNLLQHFYADMSRHAYAFQSFAFFSRVAQLESIDPTKDVVFIERSIFSDREIFARNCVESGLMTDIEWQLYQKWFEWVVTHCNAPLSRAQTAYLRSDPDICAQRLQHRGRAEEAGTVSSAYLRALHDRHEAWLMHGNGTFHDDAPDTSMPVVVLNARTDFHTDGQALLEIMRQLNLCPTMIMA